MKPNKVDSAVPSSKPASPSLGSHMEQMSPPQLADYMYSIVEAHPDVFSEQYPQAMREGACVIEKLWQERARLVATLRDTAEGAESLCEPAAIVNRARVLLRELGELE